MESMAELIKIELADFGNLFRSTPTNLLDQELLSLDYLLHRAWKVKREEGRVHFGEKPWSFEDMVNLHILVKEEMSRRAFRHNFQDELDTQSQRLSQAGTEETGKKIDEGNFNEEEIVVDLPDESTKGLYFPIMGGLKPYRSKILPFPEHKAYIEVFCGCGEMLWEKEPSQKEIMADIDPEIIFMHKFCKRLTEDQVSALRRKNWVASKGQYERIKRLQPRNEIERFHKNIYLRSFSRVEGVWNKNTFRPTDTGREYSFDRILKARDRLRNVRIERSDWHKTLKIYDSPNTLFFLDPPYEGKEKYYTHGLIDYRDLADQLRKVKGKFVLVVKLNLDTVPAFKGFHIDRFFWRHRLSAISDHVPTKSIAYIIRNFKPGIVKNSPVTASAQMLEKELDAYLDVPPEDREYRYVFQHHWRGRTVHGDFRLETVAKDSIIGWTLADMVPDVVKDPVESLEEAKKQSADGTAFKIDFKNGRFEDRETSAGNVVPAQIRAFPKARHPRSWLEVEGLTPPYPAPGSTPNFRGVFLIEDKGICEYGVQKDDVHEYFLKGKLKGRLLFRRFPAGEFQGSEKILPPAEAEEGDLTTSEIWMAIQPIDQTPLVISDGEVENKWIPPFEISALPPAVRDKVPAHFQYWRIKNRDGALGARDALVQALKSGDVKIDFDSLVLGVAKKSDSDVSGEPQMEPVLEKAAPFHIFGRFTGRIFSAVLKSFPEHQTYVEAFAGPAQFFHSKERSDVEVLADKDSKIVQMHRTIRDLTSKDFQKLSQFYWGKLRKSRFRSLAQKEFSDPLHELWRVIMLKRNSIGHGLDFKRRAHYRNEPIAVFKSAILGRLQKANERLRGVRIYRSDFEKTIKAWDGKDSFFILDPPFFERDEFYGVGFSLEDIKRLCKTLGAMKGKFILLHTPTKSFDLTDELSQFHCHKFFWASPMQHLSLETTYENRKLLVFWNFGKENLIKSAFDANESDSDENIRYFDHDEPDGVTAGSLTVPC